MLDNLLQGNIFYSEDPGAGGVEVGKTFTQEEVDKIISVRLERESIKHQRELEERDKKIKELGFESYDDIARLKKERDDFQTKSQEYEQKLSHNERVNKIKSLGVDEKFIDFVLFKVKDDDELEDFIKENPNYTAENFKKSNSNPDYSGGKLKSLKDAESDEEYLRLRRGNK